MFAVLSCSTATMSPVPKSSDPRRILRHFPLLLGLALGLCGCHTHRAAPAPPLTSARSRNAPSSAIAQIQSTPLYRQARQDCAKHDYQHAASLLELLAKTPGLAPAAVTFVQQQRAICLQDAGVATPTVPAVTSPSAAAPSPTDADCGPRALLLLCQQLGIKTNLETLRLSAGTTMQGTSMEGLQKAAEKLGLKAEGVQFSREALPDIATPALAWDRRNHFIQLCSLSGRGEEATATIHDPNKATTETLSQENLLQRCGGYLLLIHR